MLQLFIWLIENGKQEYYEFLCTSKPQKFLIVMPIYPDPQ